MSRRRPQGNLRRLLGSERLGSWAQSTGDSGSIDMVLILDEKEESADWHLWGVKDAADSAGKVSWGPLELDGVIHGCSREQSLWMRLVLKRQGIGEVDMCVTMSERAQSVMDWTFLSLWLEFYWLRNYFPPDVWMDKWTGGMESQCIFTCETAHDKVCGIFRVTGSWFLERKKKAFLSSSVPHMQLPQIDRSSSTDSPSSRSPRTMAESETSVQPHTGWWVNGKLTSPCSSTCSIARWEGKVLSVYFWRERTKIAQKSWWMIDAPAVEG